MIKKKIEVNFFMIFIIYREINIIYNILITYI